MNKQKRPYLKPELTQVSLRPEEAVLANCKITSIGNGAVNCNTPSGCRIS